MVRVSARSDSGARTLGQVRRHYREGTPVLTTEAIAAAIPAHTVAVGGGALELGARNARVSVTPDQLASIGAYVAREYGDHGHWIEYLWSVTGAVTLAQVRSGDGGRFIVAGDRWSNVATVDTSSAASMAEAIAAMHNRAVTV